MCFAETPLSQISEFLAPFLTCLHCLTNYSNHSVAESLNSLPPFYNPVTKPQPWLNPVLSYTCGWSKTNNHGPWSNCEVVMITSLCLRCCPTIMVYFSSLPIFPFPLFSISSHLLFSPQTYPMASLILTLC